MQDFFGVCILTAPMLHSKLSPAKASPPPREHEIKIYGAG